MPGGCLACGSLSFTAGVRRCRSSAAWYRRLTGVRCSVRNTSSRGALTCNCLEDAGHHLPILTIEKPDDLQTGGRVLCKTAQPANCRARTVSAVVAVRCAARWRPTDDLGRRIGSALHQPCAAPTPRCRDSHEHDTYDGDRD